MDDGVLGSASLFEDGTCSLALRELRRPSCRAPVLSISSQRLPWLSYKEARAVRTGKRGAPFIRLYKGKYLPMVRVRDEVMCTHFEEER